MPARRSRNGDNAPTPPEETPAVTPQNLATLHQPEVSRVLYSVLDEFFKPIDSIDVLSLVDEDEDYQDSFPLHARKVDLLDSSKPRDLGDLADLPADISAVDFVSKTEQSFPLKPDERQAFLERLVDYEPLAGKKSFTLASLLRAYVYNSPYDRKNHSLLGKAIIYLFRGLITVLPGQATLLKISLHETSEKLIDYPDASSLVFSQVLLCLLLTILRRFDSAIQNAQQRMDSKFELEGPWPKIREGIPLPALEEEWDVERLTNCYEHMATGVLDAIFDLFSIWFTEFALFWPFTLTEYLKFYVTNLANPKGVYLRTTPYMTWDGAIIDPVKTAPPKELSDSAFVLQNLAVMADRMLALFLNYKVRCSSGAFAITQLRSGLLFSEQVTKADPLEICVALNAAGSDIFRAIDTSLLPLGAHPHPYTEIFFSTEKSVPPGIDPSNLLESYCSYVRIIAERIRQTLLQATSSREYASTFSLWYDVMTFCQGARDYAACISIYSALKESDILNNKYLLETDRGRKLRATVEGLDFSILRMENLLLDKAPCVPALDLYFGKVPRLVLRPGTNELSSQPASESVTHPDDTPGVSDPYRVVATPIADRKAADVPPYTSSQSARVYLNSYEGPFSDLLSYADYVSKICTVLQRHSYVGYRYLTFLRGSQKQISVVEAD